MTQRSFPDVSLMSDGCHLEDLISAGDWVTTGANVAPHYHVIAICGDKAWIRDVERGHDGITALCRCHKVEGPGVWGCSGQTH
jgi:hypothetical protein